MKSFRSILSVSLLGLATVLAGCTADTGEGSEDVAALATNDTTAPAAADTKGALSHGRHGGPDSLVRAALRADLGLSAEQKTVLEGLVAKKPNVQAEGQKEHRGFDKERATALATAIRAGKVESMTRPEPTAEQKAQHEARRAEHLATAAKNLDTLHATLTPEQRTKLVAALESHQRPEGKRPEHEDGKEHAQRGQRHGGFGAMLADLKLTDAQKAALKEGRPAKKTGEARKAAFEAMRAERKDKLESFATDAFDATAFVTPKQQAKPHTPKQNPLTALVAVLQPEQREQLALRIEQGPEARPQRSTAN